MTWRTTRRVWVQFNRIRIVKQLERQTFTSFYCWLKLWQIGLLSGKLASRNCRASCLRFWSAHTWRNRTSLISSKALQAWGFVFFSKEFVRIIRISIIKFQSKRSVGQVWLKHPQGKTFLGFFRWMNPVKNSEISTLKSFSLIHPRLF